MNVGSRFPNARQSHGLRVTVNHLLLIFVTGGQKSGVKFRVVVGFRQLNPVVAAEVAGLALNAAFGSRCRMQMARLMRSNLGFGQPIRFIRCGARDSVS